MVEIPNVNIVSILFFIVLHRNIFIIEIMVNIWSWYVSTPNFGSYIWSTVRLLVFLNFFLRLLLGLHFLKMLSNPLLYFFSRSILCQKRFSLDPFWKQLNSFLSIFLSFFSFSLSWTPVEVFCYVIWIWRWLDCRLILIN